MSEGRRIVLKRMNGARNGMKRNNIRKNERLKKQRNNKGKIEGKRQVYSKTNLLKH